MYPPLIQKGFTHGHESAPRSFESQLADMPILTTFNGSRTSRATLIIDLDQSCMWISSMTCSMKPLSKIFSAKNWHQYHIRAKSSCKSNLLIAFQSTSRRLLHQTDAIIIVIANTILSWGWLSLWVTVSRHAHHVLMLEVIGNKC